MSTPAFIAVAIACFSVESVKAHCSLIKSSQSETEKPENPIGFLEHLLKDTYLHDLEYH